VPGWAEKRGTLQQLWADKGPAFFFKHNPYAEWYLNTMHISGSGTQRHHEQTYGPDFDYDGFIPMFNEGAAKLAPGAWADLFAQSGARYVVLTTKHHDGFVLWPSGVPHPNRPDYASPRDIVGEVTQAVRSRGLKMGLYYSGGYDKTFDPTVIHDIATGVTAIPRSAEYAAYCDAHLVELIDRYQPSVLWNDIAYPAGGELARVLAHYYNTVSEGVINDRWIQVRLRGFRRGVVLALARAVSAGWRFLPRSARRLQVQHGRHFDYTTPEYAQYEGITARKWEAVRALGPSFGANRTETDEDMLSVAELVHLFADIVSKNGNLLLGIGPAPDGTFPQTQTSRLLALGDWLRTSGEAVYDTRPWLRAEGRTRDGLALRFTCTDAAVYAIVLGQPPAPELSLEDLRAREGAEISMLGHAAPLPWRQDGADIVISLPGPPPVSPAASFRIAPAPEPIDG